ncbi:MAG: thioredoxin domain-containing protein [bacterium]
MSNNQLKKFIVIIVAFIISLPALKDQSFAKVEWEILENITLEDSPLDITISKDGTVAYILGTKNILIYSIEDKKTSDIIPIQGTFSQIAISPDGEKLYLTNKKSKQVSILKIATIYDIEVGQSPVMGKPGAPVTIVAFLDYQCPYCTKVYPVLEQLLEQYPKDVNLIIKHYPLQMHPFAQKASQAALAASKQNKYQEMTKILMLNSKNLNDTTIKKYAEEIGLDMIEFDKAYNDPSNKKIINQDMQTGAQVKVRGVPALFINGRGAKNRSLNALSAMIRSELKKK